MSADIIAKIRTMVVDCAYEAPRSWTLAAACRFVAVCPKPIMEIVMTIIQNALVRIASRTVQGAASIAASAAWRALTKPPLRASRSAPSGSRP